MIDVSKYEKIGECRDGRMIWLSPKKENIVYLIMFGEESYIGSSKNIRRRFSQYVPALTRGKYEAEKVQAAFNKNKGFDVYAIEITSTEDPDKLRDREHFYLKTLNPSLNSRTNVSYTYRNVDPNTAKKKPNKTELKGIETYITTSAYERLNKLKDSIGRLIRDMVKDAIIFWLDVQDGKIVISTNESASR